MSVTDPLTLDDDQLVRLNRFERPPRRGYALRGGGLYKNGLLVGALQETPAHAAIEYSMKPRSTDLIVEIRYTPIDEHLSRRVTK